ncbi:MAG: DUF4405 domain-containing protein [Chitinophagaceae bacterium]
MNKNYPGKWKKFSRNTWMVMLDIILTLLLLLLFSPLLTGLALHELAGMFFFLLVILHLLFSWSWIAQSVKGINLGNNWRKQFNFLLNSALFILVVLQVVSGLSISQVTLPSLGIKTINDWSWRSLHNTCYQWMVIIISVHIALNLPRLINYFRKKMYCLAPSQKNVLAREYGLTKGITRISLILLTAFVIGSVAYLLLGFPSELRLNTVDEIKKFRPKIVPGVVQYTGAGIVLSILVYMAYRWLKLRL